MKRVNFLSFVTASLLLAVAAYSQVPGPKQAPAELWSRHYGDAVHQESAVSIHATVTNGFVLGGTRRTLSGDSSSMHLLVTDGYGDFKWEQFYSGTGHAQGRSVTTTNEGGFVIAGFTDFGTESSRDHFIVNADSAGKFEWDKISDHPGEDLVADILQARGGGFISTGRSPSTDNTFGTFHLMKTNKPGKEVWTKNFAGEQGNSVIEISDGYLVAAGYTTRIPESARPPQPPEEQRLPWEQRKTHEDTAACKEEAGLYLVEVDFAGVPQWEHVYWKSGFDIAYDVVSSGDGGFAMAGAAGGCTDNPDKYDAYILRTNSNGDTLWTYTFQGGREDRARSIARCSDGGYIICGYTFSFGAGQSDMLIFKLDDNGKLLWSTTSGGRGFDYAFSVIQTSDGGYAVCGETSSSNTGDSDMFLLKLAGD